MVHCSRAESGVKVFRPQRLEVLYDPWPDVEDVVPGERRPLLDQRHPAAHQEALDTGPQAARAAPDNRQLQRVIIVQIRGMTSCLDDGQFWELPVYIRYILCVYFLSQIFRNIDSIPTPDDSDVRRRLTVPPGLCHIYIGPTFKVLFSRALAVAANVYTDNVRHPPGNLLCKPYGIAQR